MMEAAFARSARRMGYSVVVRAQAADEWAKLFNEDDGLIYKAVFTLVKHLPVFPLPTLTRLCA